VGVHSDEDVTLRRGAHLPIMSVHERCLSVMACKHVDEVIIGALPAGAPAWLAAPPAARMVCMRALTARAAAGAPHVVSEDLLKSFNIATVVRGTLSETFRFVEHDEKRYEVPKAKGIFRCVRALVGIRLCKSMSVFTSATMRCAAAQRTCMYVQLAPPRGVPQPRTHGRPQPHVRACMLSWCMRVQRARVYTQCRLSRCSCATEEKAALCVHACPALPHARDVATGALQGAGIAERHDHKDNHQAHHPQLAGIRGAASTQGHQRTSVL
jgi:hypothetical protein